MVSHILNGTHFTEKRTQNLLYKIRKKKGIYKLFPTYSGSQALKNKGGFCMHKFSHPGRGCLIGGSDGETAIRSLKIQF